MAEPGPATTAMLAIGPRRDDRVLAGRICGACVEHLDVDSAAISMFTTSTPRHTQFASDPTAELLEELQFTLGEGACMEAAHTGRPMLSTRYGT